MPFHFGRNGLMSRAFEFWFFCCCFFPWTGVIIVVCLMHCFINTGEVIIENNIVLHFQILHKVTVSS